MENFEKKFNNSVNNASVSTGNKKSTIVKVVIGATIIGGAALIYWAKKKFSSKPSPEVEEVKVDENGFEEIKK